VLRSWLKIIRAAASHDGVRCDLLALSPCWLVVNVAVDGFVRKNAGMNGTNLLAVVGLVVGLFGILAAFGAAWWFGRGPRLVTQVSGTTLISAPDNPRIRVLYDDRDVHRITQSLIWLWREGRGTIKGSDIDSDDPVAVAVPNDVRILDVSVLAQSKDTNKVEVLPDSSDETRAIVSFKYLEPRQGAVIEVLHTGKSPAAVALSGTIMGVPKGITPVEPGVPVLIALAGPAGVITIPTHSIPRSLRIPTDQTHRQRPIFEGGVPGFIERVIRSIARYISP
jgi:hypothetical protein